MQLEGMFLQLNAQDQAVILAAVRRDGFPATVDGVKSWVLLKATQSNTGAGMIGTAARAAVQFAKENPQVLRDGITIGRAILKLRS